MRLRHLRLHRVRLQRVGAHARNDQLPADLRRRYGTSIDDSSGGNTFKGDLFAPNGTINIGGGSWTTFAEGLDVERCGWRLHRRRPIGHRDHNGAIGLQLPAPVMRARDRRRVGPRSMLARGARGVLIVAIFGSCLMMLLGMTGLKQHTLLFDFKGGLYNAGHEIVHGHNPYQPRFLANQAAILRAGGIARGENSLNAFSIPVYPAPINLAVVPLSLLPFWLAGALFTLLSIAAMVVGLRLLGVRDWRCFAVALLSWPFVFALDLGALGPLLVLGAGIMWRWRDRLWPPALALASIVVAKVFPWPLGIWLLVTKRYRALALAIAIGGVATFAAWSVIGFAGMAQYPQMLSNLSLIQEGRAVSLVAVLLAIGVPVGPATAAAFAVTAGLLATAWRFARRPGGDRQAFGLAVIAALTATPIVWEHYMVLLFVPIALLSPRFSRLWLVPVCTPMILVISAVVVPLGSTVHGADPDTIRATVVWLALEAIVVFKLVRTPLELRTGSRSSSRLRTPRWLTSGGLAARGQRPAAGPTAAR